MEYTQRLSSVYVLSSAFASVALPAPFDPLVTIDAKDLTTLFHFTGGSVLTLLVERGHKPAEVGRR